MSVVYRAVKANNSNDVIAIGYDENQGGKDYNGIGTWCDFTFDEIPEAHIELPSTLQLTDESSNTSNPLENLPINLLKVDNNAIVAKTTEEVMTKLEALSV